MSGPLIGLIVSIVAILTLSISMYWAAKKTVQENNPTYEPTYNTVTKSTMETIKNRSVKSPVLTPQSTASWGTIPGEFNSKYDTIMNVNTYANDFLSSHNVAAMQKRIDNGEDKRTVIDEHFKGNVGDQRKVGTTRQADLVIDTEKTTTDYIAYTAYNTFDENTIGSDNITTINYEGLNLWWQMQNLPTFLKAWQSFSQVANKMYTQNFQNFMYAHLMWSSPQFNITGNYASLGAAGGVMADCDQTNTTLAIQTAVYNDIKFGMSTERNLTIWVAAKLGNADAVSVLQNHWFGGMYRLNADSCTVTTILNGTNSVFTTMAASIQAKVIAKGVLTTAAMVNNGNLAALQWATGSLLNDPTLAVDPTYYKSVNSMADIGMNFLAQPEITQSGCDTTFTYQDGVRLFNQDLDPTKTFKDSSLLSPGNMFQFYEWVATEQWTSIQGTFGISQAQAMCINSYSYQQADYNTYQAYANMMVQTIASSLKQIGTYFPINIASRTLAYRFKNYQTLPAPLPTANHDCTAFMTAAGVPAATVTTVCATYNFNNITDVQFFASGTWYGDWTAIKAATGMDDTMLTAFYNWNVTTSFGYALKQSQEFNYEKYVCPSAMQTQYQKNCSAEYIAAGQWGASQVTLTPPYVEAADEYYFPETVNADNSTSPCLTIANWTVPGISMQAPEYFYYSQFFYNPSPGAQGAPAFSPVEVGNLTGDSYSYFGLNNTYNAKMVYYYYSIEDVSNVQNSFMNNTVQAFGLNSKQQLYNFMSTLDWMIQDFTLGGLTATRSLKDVVLGWNSKLINNLAFEPETNYNDYYYKTGDAIIYNPHITPLLDGTQTLRSQQNPLIMVNTGASNSTMTGLIKSISGYNYPNRQFKVYNGQSSFQYLPFRCSAVDFTKSDVYVWMQGKPNQVGFNVNVMNLVNMQVTQQIFQDTEQICEAGTGAACDPAVANVTVASDAYLIDSHNTELQNVYAKTAQFYPNGNCGSRIFSHGTGSQANKQDRVSGLPSAYDASLNSYLSYDSLSTEAPGLNGPAMLHPFASLKALYQNLGANQQIQLSTEQQEYKVNNTDFINVQYPVNTVTPTVQVSVSYTEQVQNGTREIPHYTSKTEVKVWVIIVFVLLIIVFTVIAVCSFMKMQQAKAAADLGSSIAHTAGETDNMLADNH